MFPVAQGQNPQKCRWEASILCIWLGRDNSRLHAQELLWFHNRDPFSFLGAPARRHAPRPPWTRNQPQQPAKVPGALYDNK